ncbi:MAG: tetratricopeptide repeat protein [Candidatus Krumholzibacteriia bacterium]
MSKTRNASAPDPGSTGLGRKRRERSRLRRAARVRAAFLCALLGAGLVIAGRPELFWEAVEAMRPELQEDMPRLPADALLRTAEAAHAGRNFEESARLYGLLVAQHPEHSAVEDALIARMHALTALGDAPAAQLALEEYRLLYPSSAKLPRLLLEMATWQYGASHYHQAARGYTDLIALMTRNERTRRPVEDTAPPSAAMRKAIAREKRRLTAERTRVERLARFNLALCYEMEGKPRPALRSYERFVRRFPTDERTAEAQFRMGVLLLEAGRLGQAVQQFKSVCTAERAPVEFRAASIYHAGRCLEKLLHGEDARETYRLAIDVRPFDNDYRLASLSRLAQLLQKREPLRALDIYHDLAESNDHPVRRAIARQHLIELQGESTMAAALH